MYLTRISCTCTLRNRSELCLTKQTHGKPCLARFFFMKMGGLHSSSVAGSGITDRLDMSVDYTKHVGAENKPNQPAAI